jgi:hypothetical protein
MEEVCGCTLELVYPVLADLNIVTFVSTGKLALFFGKIKELVTLIFGPREGVLSLSGK